MVTQALRLDAAADSVVARVRDDADTEGYGEGTPRPYVTGETVETMLDHLANDLWPRVADREVPPADLEALIAFLPRPARRRDRAARESRRARAGAARLLAPPRGTTPRRC